MSKRQPLPVSSGRPIGPTPRAGLAVVALCASACLLGTPSPVLPAHVVDRIIAIVNTEVITLSELKAEIADEEKRLRARYRGRQLDQRLKQVQYSGLTRMIERKLQMQIAQKKGLEVSDEEVNRAVAEVRRQGGKIDPSDPKERASIREQLTLMRVVDREVRSGVMASETEYRRYYEEHKSRFMLPHEYRISQILIRRKASETPEESESRANGVLALIKKGTDFEAVALQYSDGTDDARGGNLGFVRQGELLPQIERAVAALEPGQLSDLIETSQGFHIIRLDEKKPPQYRPYGEVKAEIQQLVYQQKTEDVYQVWMADLKDKSYIEVKF